MCCICKVLNFVRIFIQVKLLAVDSSHMHKHPCWVMLDSFEYYILVLIMTDFVTYTPVARFTNMDWP